MNNVVLFILGACVGFLLGAVLLSIIFVRRFRNLKRVIQEQVIKKGEED